jgi:hypothetical protein
VRAWKKIVPGTPFFGTIAVDDMMDFRETQTIYNGVNKKDAMPFVLCYGNITPRFFIATLPENSAVSLRAVVTKSKDNLVYEVNDTNAKRFFADAGVPDNMLIIPFMIDLLKQDDYDGVPVIRGSISFTEDGAAIFNGDVDEGSGFSLLKFTSDDILTSSLHGFKGINAVPAANGALLFSCIARRVMFLGAGKPLAELQTARDTIHPDIPFMMGYSGGEICPTSVKNDVPTNRFHTYSLVILVI